MKRHRVYVNASEVGRAAFDNKASSYMAGAQGERLRERGSKAHESLNESLTNPQDKRCFIASYVLGYDHPGTQVLRDWRDSHLMGNKLGMAFVRAYYKASPHLIGAFGASRLFFRLSQIAVMVMVKWVQPK